MKCDGSETLGTGTELDPGAEARAVELGAAPPPCGDFDPEAFVASLTSAPGVYRMLDEEGKTIYVGKARNLRRRVGSYFRSGVDSPKTRAMLARVRGMEATVTHTEGEALLLENQLIKSLKPRYNVLLRDDKSYPYIYLSTHQRFPRLSFHRGSRRGPGRWFGPYPSAGAVRETLAALQKVFPVRQCRDGFFRNRSRPCLQYQIKRCTAPCVGYIDEAEYRRDVRYTELFLAGKDTQVVDELVVAMQRAAEGLEYERAAELRDRIARLRRIQERQHVDSGAGDLDVVACAVKGGVACVEVVYVRDGRHLGSKSFFPRGAGDEQPAAVLSAFLPQYYLDRGDLPARVLVAEPIDAAELLGEVLSRRAGRRVKMHHPRRGQWLQWLRMAETNAAHGVARFLAGKANLLQRFQALQEALGMAELPTRLECFDISHTMGEATVASCVVFGAEGPLKSDYRRFNIEGITPGDDFAAMHQALTRRYTRIVKGEGRLPDLLLIDGGKGQLARAAQVMEELQVEGVTLVGVAKGEGRKPGLESLFLSGGGGAIILPADSPALHLVQQVRDEAHRFAIAGHRQRRAKARRGSPLERIPGLGAKRRRWLLTQFGGLQEVERAGVEDLARVSGIGRQLAQRIYDALHE
jgi:excinuclease ABC subunit C